MSGRLYAGKSFDVAEAVLGRDRDDRLVVEAIRPKSDQWRVEVDPDLASSPLGQVARHHFDEGDLEGDVWLVSDEVAQRLVAVLSHHDVEGLLALVATTIRNTENKEF